MEILSSIRDLRDLLQGAADDFRSRRRRSRGVASVIGAVLILSGQAYYAGKLSVLAATALMASGVLVWLWTLWAGGHRRERVTPVHFSVLKGTRPFGSEDKELFQGLGRANELAELKDWVASEQVGVILLWGPTGVGKTSLVNAGLRAAPAMDVRYVDANQESAIEELTELIQGGSGGSQPNRGEPTAPTDLLKKKLDMLLEEEVKAFDPVAKFKIRQDIEETQRELSRLSLVSSQSVEEMNVAERTERGVLIVDNVEQGQDQAYWKDSVRASAARGSPYRRVLILVLEEDLYKREWEGEDWGMAPLSIRAKELKRFGRREALSAASVLARRASLRIADKLLESIVDDLVFRSGDNGASEGDRDQVISPLALSVVLHSIGKISGGQPFRLQAYRDFGEGTGAMMSYVREHMSGMRNWRGLLAEIIKQADQSGQIARSSLSAGWSEAELRVALAGLSGEELRILNPSRDHSTFRILVEWRKAFEQLRPISDPAEIGREERARRKFEEWSHRQDLDSSSFSRRVGEGRLLLTTREVREIGRSSGGIRFSGNGHFADYLSRSRRFRTAQRLVVVFALVSFFPAAVSLYRMFTEYRTVLMMQRFGLPRDFHEYGGQLIGLVMVCGVDDLHWLPRNLSLLDANCEKIVTLSGAPPRLRHLGVSGTHVRNLDDIPPGVQTLILAGTDVVSLKGLEAGRVKTLDVSGMRLPDMRAIPRSVEKLMLQHPDIQSLEGLPEKLTDLELRGTSVRSLKSLPESLRRLTLEGNPFLQIDVLPSRLERLETDRFPQNVAVPDTLRALVLSGKGGSLVVKDVPGNLRELEVKNASVAKGFPLGLEALKIHDNRFPVDITKLPADLRYLKVQWPKGKSFGFLPRQLIELDLSRSESLTSLAGVGRVLDLNISHTEIRDFREVPNSVTNLHFESCVASALRDFPPKLEKLFLGDCPELEILENLPDSLTELHVEGTPIATLEGLPKTLLRLDISNTEITGKLPVLPPRLKELVLHIGQIRTLEGLPKSVRRIVFVEDERLRSGGSAADR